MVTKPTGKLSVWATGFIPFIREYADDVSAEEFTQKFNGLFGHIITKPLTEDEAFLMQTRIHQLKTTKKPIVDFRTQSWFKRGDDTPVKTSAVQSTERSTLPKESATNEPTPDWKDNGHAITTKECKVTKPTKREATDGVVTTTEDQFEDIPLGDHTVVKDIAAVISDDDGWSMVSDDDSDWTFL